MRKLSKWAFIACAAMLGNFGHAFAGQPLACRDYAEIAADIWARDLIRPADDFEKPGSGNIVVISGGHKYFMPKRQPDDTNGHLISVGQRIHERDRVYHEEYLRCLDSDIPIRTGTN
jgi:hypothetical protein